MSKLECWSFIISWSFDIWFIPLTQLTVEVWPEGFFKSWFKPFTASSWKTLFFTWSEKLLFLITSVPVINLSTWALIKFGDEATSLLEEEYSRRFTIYQINFAIFITLITFITPRLLKPQFSTVFLFGITIYYPYSSSLKGKRVSLLYWSTLNCFEKILFRIIKRKKIKEHFLDHTFVFYFYSRQVIEELSCIWGNNFCLQT